MGFPVVLSKHSQLLAGFTFRKEILSALGKATLSTAGISSLVDFINLAHAKHTHDVSVDSPVYFATNPPRYTNPSEPPPVSLRVCLDKVSDCSSTFLFKMMMYVRCRIPFLLPILHRWKRSWKYFESLDYVSCLSRTMGEKNFFLTC